MPTTPIYNVAYRGVRSRPAAKLSACVLVVWLAPELADAQESEAELVRKLNNPVASLTTVPLQFNHDCCFGPHEGAREVLNIQPVIPISLNPDWNLIVRTIAPVIHQARTAPQAGGVTGLGDITQSFFVSPKATRNGVTWAVGPVFLWPTGEGALGAERWGAGPTALVLRQTGGWTTGVLANHLWSYADHGGAGRQGVSTTFVQPFLSWTGPTHTTVGINTEASYDWKARKWTVPVNMTVAHLYRVGDQRVQLTGGVRVYAASPRQGPQWGLRFVATFLFPR